MSISIQLPTLDDLKQLALGAIVAYAARSARRVQPLYGCPGDAAERAEHEAAVEGAIALAEAFCHSHEAKTSAYGAAYAAREAATDERARAAARAASGAARAAAYAFDLPKSAVYDHAVYASRVVAEAADAAEAAGRAAAAEGPSAVEAAARADFDRLRQLNSGTYPQLGHPLDPSEQGPLGPLWSTVPPAWFVR
jgi:hypothetical protein